MSDAYRRDEESVWSGSNVEMFTLRYTTVLVGRISRQTPFRNHALEQKKKR